MKILVDRRWKKENYTIGIIYVNGNRFSNSLEPTDRGLISSMSLDEIKKRKIYGKTAVPTGTYKVIMSYSNKFKKYLPEVLDIKGFAGVRFHSGNTEKDTLACCLPGQNTQKGMVTNSRYYTDTLCSMIDAALKKKEEVTVEYR